MYLVCSPEAMEYVEAVPSEVVIVECVTACEVREVEVEVEVDGSEEKTTVGTVPRQFSRLAVDGNKRTRQKVGFDENGLVEN